MGRKKKRKKKKKNPQNTQTKESAFLNGDPPYLIPSVNPAVSRVSILIDKFRPWGGTMASVAIPYSQVCPSSGLASGKGFVASLHSRPQLLGLHFHFRSPGCRQAAVARG